MKPLTPEYVTQNKMSANDCVKYFNPEWSEEQCSFHIWEQTCFPFYGTEFIKQLNEQFLPTDKQ